MTVDNNDVTSVAIEMKVARKSVVRGLFKGGSIIFVGLALELGISFFGKILMARVLGQVDYGIATLGIKVLSFASAILLIGVNTGVGRYLPRFDREADRKGVILSGLELALVLLGHFVAVWVAHAAGYRLLPGRLEAIKSQYAITVVMICYTMISLWIVSTPSVTPPFLGGGGA